MLLDTRRRTFNLCMVGALSLGVAVSGISRAAAGTPEHGISAARLQRWAQVREQFGFRHDRDYLTHMKSVGLIDAASLGIPMTAAERREVARRNGLGRYVAAIARAGRGSSAFGGVSVDQASGGKIVIDLVRRPGAARTDASLERRLRALAPASDPVTVSTVRYSAAQIADTYTGIEAAFVQGRLDKLGISGVTETGQRIQLMITGARSQTNAASLMRMFPAPFVTVSWYSHGTDPQVQRTRLPAAGRSVPASGNGPRDLLSGPLYGGAWIGRTDSRYLYSCTIGYSYNKTTSTHFWTATAGHCGDYGNQWYQGHDADGNHFGSGGLYNGAGKHSANTTQKCDCQVIGQIPTSAATNQVFVSGNGHYSYTATPSNTSADYYNGRSVCTNGAHYAQDHGDAIVCGTIQNVNALAYYSTNNIHFTNLVQTSVTTTEDGDSGASVGSGHDFMGVHNGLLSNGHQYFSRSTYIGGTTSATPSYP